MNKMTIQDVDVKGKKCFVRVDFNVPLDENGKITDETRIKGALPTIDYLVKNKAKVILGSHLGRPKGFDAKNSLKPVADRLSEIYKNKFTFAKDVIGEDAAAKVKNLKDGEILLLENLRFHKEEEANDGEFCKKLAAYADIYVNDAFGTAHRAHASTAGISKFVKISVAGFLIAKELEIMGGALENPKRPFVAILGGAKVSDKIELIQNLLTKVDVLLIGGAMAYTFIKAQGSSVGSSRCENDKLELAKELLAQAKAKKVKMLLPVDNVIAESFSNDAPFKTVDSCKIPDGWMGLDIGEKTIKAYSDEIAKAGTVVWNGPMGVFEMSNFANGTNMVAKALAKSKAITIIGGGDSAAAVTQLGYADKMTHISTGGGASLEYLQGLELPGVACLTDSNCGCCCGCCKK